MNIEDPAQLQTYLRHHGYLRAGTADPEFRTLAGGVSNATVLVRFADGQAWVVKQALGKLRTKVDWFSPVHRIHREAAGMVALKSILPDGAVPALVFQDQSHHLLAMTGVPEPHENLKDLFLSGRFDPSHARTLATLLAAIHRAGAERWQAMAREFGDRSFFESLRLEPYYLYAAKQTPAAAPFLEQLCSETMDRRLSLVHGDYSPKNVLVRGDTGQLVLLDHEVIHFGDPAFDVGFFLTHLLSKANHLAQHRKMFASAAVDAWRTYFAGLGDIPKLFVNRKRPEHPDPESADGYASRCARHTLACLLARVAGRSTLEYLSPDERDRQQRAVLELIADLPATPADVAESFVARL